MHGYELLWDQVDVQYEKNILSANQNSSPVQGLTVLYILLQTDVIHNPDRIS